MPPRAKPTIGASGRYVNAFDQLGVAIDNVVDRYVCVGWCDGVCGNP